MASQKKYWKANNIVVDGRMIGSRYSKDGKEWKQDWGPKETESGYQRTVPLCGWLTKQPEKKGASKERFFIALPGVLREIHYYKQPSEIEAQKPFLGRIIIYDDTVIRYTSSTNVIEIINDDRIWNLTALDKYDAERWATGLAAQGGSVEGLPEALSTGQWTPAGSLQIKSAGNLGGMLVGEGAGAGGAGSAVGRGDRGLGGGATALVSIPAAAGRGQHQHVSVGATAETPQQNTFTPAPVMLTFVAHADVEGWHVKDEGARVVVEGVGSGHLSFVGIHATKGTPRCGVSLDSPFGKNNGTINGAVYFQCPPGHGLLTNPKKVQMEADVLNDMMASLGVDAATASTLLAQRIGAAAPAVVTATPGAGPVFCKNCGHSMLGSGLLFCTECGMRT